MVVGASSTFSSFVDVESVGVTCGSKGGKMSLSGDCRRSVSIACSELVEASIVD